MLFLLQAMYRIRRLSSIEFKSGQDYERYNAERLNLRTLVIKEDLSTPSEFSEYQERFESQSQIGSGTFGSVYLLKDKSTSELAAAKYLRQDKEKVRFEAEILFKLIESSFVVQLIGLYESPLNSVLVTEYLAGGDLVTRYVRFLSIFFQSILKHIILGLPVMNFASLKRSVKYL